MVEMGLGPRTQTADSVTTRRISGEVYVAGARVTNLIGVLPGRDRTLPALALMAHYDTVPGSPGAADDSTGVADAMEIVRAIAARGRPARDVDLILTEGEELGLLGARSFFANDPLAAHIGLVINLEARGGGGRAAMFQMGPGDGAEVALFAAHAKAPDSTSLLPFIYRYLPNDTDFTVSLAHGAPGYNLAFIGRQFDYHSPSSTVAVLDEGSVQHMGEEILGTADAVAFARTLPARTPDIVFSDILGLGIAHYPPVWGWLAAGLAAVLILVAATLAAMRGRLAPLSLGLGALAGLAILAGDALLLFAAREITGAGSGWFAYRPILARFSVFELAMTLTALAGVLATAALIGRGGRTTGAWIGLLLLGLAASVAVQIFAPLAAFVIAWPLLAASACAAVTSAGTAKAPLAWVIYGLIAVVSLAWVGNFLHAMLEGLDAAPVCAIFAWLAAMILWPLAAPAPGPERATTSRVPRGLALGSALAAAVVCLILGFGLAGWMRVSDPWSARFPRAVEPEMIAAQGRVWRATLPPLDGWTRTFLGPGPVTRLDDIPGQPPLIARPDSGVVVAPPSLSLAPGPGGGEVLSVRFDPAARAVALDVKATTPLALVSLNGQTALTNLEAGVLTHIHWRATAGEPLTLTIKGAAPGTATIRYALSEAGWPPGAAPIPPLPADHMAWGDPPPTTIVTGRLSGSLGAP